MTDFRLPSDGLVYTEAVFSRCRMLIQYGLWSGISQTKLESWINNFDSDEERYFGAKVLDALIYRSDDQTIALMKQLVQRSIPDCIRPNDALKFFYQDLRGVVEPRVRLVPVVPPDTTGKSGETVARMFRRDLKIRRDWIVDCSKAEKLLDKLDYVIFIDDFLGTGDQFSNDFVEPLNLETIINSEKCIYAPLSAHEEGVKNLTLLYPKLNVVHAELLGDSHSLFHEKAGFFPDSINTIETARKFYYELLDRKEIEVNSTDRRGFGYFELTYAFNLAVPDNSLPILWWDESNKWEPLFAR